MKDFLGMKDERPINFSMKFRAETNFSSPASLIEGGGGKGGGRRTRQEVYPDSSGPQRGMKDERLITFAYASYGCG